MAIILDLDDTLYLERDYVRSGISATDEWVRKTVGAAGFGAAAMAMFADGRRERLFDAAYAMLGVDASPALLARTVYEYRRHRPSISLAADAARFLDRVSFAPMAIITDGWALAQRMKVAALGLKRWPIGSIVYTDDWGRPYWKPHLRAFRHVQRELGGRDSFVYIADNPAKDFVAPHMLGWATVQVARPERLHHGAPSEPGHGAGLVVESLDQLSDAAMRSLLQRREFVTAR